MIWGLTISYKENHIHAEVVPLTGYSGIVTKVKSGELDCFVSSEATERNIKSLMGVVCIGGSDIYFAVNKNRPDLKQQLDCAMNRISVSHPFFTEELYKQYISTSTGSVLSAEEISWLDEHGPIRIAYLNNNLAFSDLDEETGELTGALAEYIDFAADCLDNRTLEFEAVPFSNTTQEMEALKSGIVDVIFPMNKRRSSSTG